MDVGDALRKAPAGPGAWERRTLQSWDPIGVLGLAVVGGLAGAVLIVLAPVDEAAHWKFVGSRGFPLWLVTICVQTAFWAVVALPLWREVVDLHRATSPSRRLLALPLLVTASVVLLLFLPWVIDLLRDSEASASASPLWAHRPKMAFLTLFSLVGVGLPALHAIALVQDRVRRHSPDEVTRADLTIAVVARDYIKRYLATAGAVIGLAVLATGALRRALLIYHPVNQHDDVISAENVFLYGTFFTAVLLVVYVPAHLTLHRLCVDLRDFHFPVTRMPAPTSPEFKDWVDGRQRLEGVTQAHLTPFQQIQSSLFIVTPLLSGAVGVLIPGLG